jgi:hypothetical protein
MFDSVLVLGCICFFCFCVYALQMRQRIVTQYPTNCDTIYYPEKEIIIDSDYLIPPSPSSPSSPGPSYKDYFGSSPDFNNIEYYG